MMEAIKNFVGTLMMLAEVVGFVLIFGIAGGVERNSLTISEGIKYWLICGGVMAVIGFAIWLLCMSDSDSDEYDAYRNHRAY